MNNDPKEWLITHDGFNASDVEKHGSKFIIGNGYAGLRGTLEEFGKKQLAACTLAGLYDQHGQAWREPVNAPHAFGASIRVNGVSLSVLTTETKSHRQQLDLRQALHDRETVFRLADGNEVTLRTRRFLSLDNVHLGAMHMAICATRPCRLEIETGINGDVWDINGPHLVDFTAKDADGILLLNALTGEQAVPVSVATFVSAQNLPDSMARTDECSISKLFEVNALPNTVYAITKYVSIRTGRDTAGVPADAAMETVRLAKQSGWDELLSANRRVWDARWTDADVVIEGDDQAQLALRYSIYHLLVIAPVLETHSIPARGLSGQVYKGGIFWDTEIFMAPFFDHVLPEIGRCLVRYRHHTLDGARRKAREYGFRGAFYAWESQETGDDACSHFNVTDVFTGRPMRTHFRDKQVHISADVALATWRHFELTGDETVLLDGGAETILECARFFVSYAWFKPEKDRYEVLDVVGPDEYHERVDNNAFTNAMVAAALRIALETVSLLRRRHPKACDELLTRLDFIADLERIRDMDARLFRPAPDPETKVIEQFTGYHKLEDTTPGELKKRVLNPTEYWGGGNGIATSTKVIKQADVVLMLHLFSADFSEEVRRANWDYYEPRTEHGSSLSPCVYALVAAALGRTEWAYKYFLRTATIDLTGDSKQYVGPLYIGGTHPAANGGAWMAAVLGFGGMRLHEGKMHLTPRLPAQWKRLSWRICWQRQRFSITMTPVRVKVAADSTNLRSAHFVVAGQEVDCPPGRCTAVTVNQLSSPASEKSPAMNIVWS